MGLVLLTGATGFVGRQILRGLTKQGLSVRLVIRDGKQGDVANLKGIESVVTSLDIFSETFEWWASVCKGVETVIHAAWYAEPGKYLQSEKNIDCLIGTLNLAKGAAKAQVRRFVGIGTCSEYDLTAGMIPIETPLNPTTPYAAAKAACFIALTQLLPQQNVGFVWCRLFYLYGEGEDSRRLVPYLREKLSSGEIAELTSGDQVRDFLDVSVAGEMIVKIALSQKQGAVNVCSGIPITVRELTERIADEYGRRDLLKFGIRSENLFDPSCVVGVKCEF